MNIDCYLQNKEIETKKIFYSKIKILENKLLDKEESYKTLLEKHEKLK